MVATDLGNDHIGFGRGGQIINVALDLVGDVRDNLHRLSQISAPTLLVQHVPVHLAGGQVGVLVQIFVDEALVVAEVEVGLGAVVGNVNLAVLERAHRARVYVDVGIELLRCNFQAAAFQQTAERCGSNALAQTGDNTAGHKDEFAICSVLL